jgi:DNA-directed RNA polymerase specialized sigma24 family protein
MNPPQDTDLLMRVASSDVQALAPIYDRHATSVYGYAWLVTRNPRDARRVLEETFAAFAREPERASSAADLRRPLLGLARSIAWSLRTRKRRKWTLRKAARAFGRGTPREFLDRIAGAPEDLAEQMALRGVEGLSVGEVQPGAEAPVVLDVPAGALWRPLPRWLRGLVLMRAADAVRPGRRYFRWFLIWAVFAASILAAALSDANAPRLPESSYRPPRGRVGAELREELKLRRQVYDIVDGFRREGTR